MERPKHIQKRVTDSAIDNHNNSALKIALDHGHTHCAKLLTQYFD